MKLKAIKVPDWLLEKVGKHVQGAATEHAVFLACIALGVRQLQNDPSLLTEAIQSTRKPKRAVKEPVPTPVLEAVEASLVSSGGIVEEVIPEASEPEVSPEPDLVLPTSERSPVSPPVSLDDTPDLPLPDYSQPAMTPNSGGSVVSFKASFLKALSEGSASTSLDVSPSSSDETTLPSSKVGPGGEGEAVLEPVEAKPKEMTQEEIDALFSNY